MELFKNIDFPLMDFLEVKTYPKGFTLLKFVTIFTSFNRAVAVCFTIGRIKK
jgi:hypothetical protein